MNRTHYMRISITDRCNLRCHYCVPRGGTPLFPKEEILTCEEIVRLARIFASLGGKKIRLTGGEPLIRPEVVEIVRNISSLEGIERVCLTTNGIHLARFADGLKQAGLKQLNISLDTLKRDRFKEITGSDGLSSVLKGISQAKEMGFDSIKLNTLVMRGINDDEILDFIAFAQEQNLVLRFIEFMRVTPLWQETQYIPVEEIRGVCRSKYDLVKEEVTTAPAEYYTVGRGTIGFIKTDRQNCERCNRLRITPEGKLKVCLYEQKGVDVKTLLRNGCSDLEIARVIKSRVGLKGDVNYSQWSGANILMSSVGG